MCKDSNLGPADLEQQLGFITEGRLRCLATSAGDRQVLKVARTQLEKVWTTHTTQQRTECVSLEGVGGGSPSYVDVLTCLEMYATRSVRPRP